MDAISSIASPVWLVPAVMVLLQTAYWVLRSQESRVVRTPAAENGERPQ